jgi:hypothetical protein
VLWPGRNLRRRTFVAILLRSWRYSRLFKGEGLKPARGMSTFEFVDSSFPPPARFCTGLARDGRQLPSEVTMDVLLYSLFCLALPLWVFAGLYLLIEIADHFKKLDLKK